MSKIDTIIHQPIRLKIMSSLVALESDEQVDFSFLKKLLSVTDGNLGAHLAKLEAAEYIQLEKVFVQKKPKTFINVTSKGTDAFKQHIAALKEIIG